MGAPVVDDAHADIGKTYLPCTIARLHISRDAQHVITRAESKKTIASRPANRRSRANESEPTRPMAGPRYAVREPGVTLVAMPRYQKLGVWCTRGRFSIRNPPLFLRSGNCGTTGHAAATIFRNFQWLLRNALTPFPLSFSLSLSLYLPFGLIYRLEQISERDTTVEINPCELGDRLPVF